MSNDIAKPQNLLNPIRESQTVETTDSSSDKKVLAAYYTEWSIYARDFQVEDIPADKLTHVFYAFTKIENGEVAIYDPWAAIQYPFNGKYTWPQSDAGLAGNFAELKVLKQQHPHLKTMMAVGGWTLSSPFSDAALTEASREKFASSAVDLMVKYGFDGLDIGWEYPVGGGLAGNINRPEDKQNYTLLLKELREELDEQEAIDNKEYELTIASPAGPATMANFELAEISQYIDFFNLMAYDYHGTWSKTTNHNAPLYAKPGELSIDSTVQAYLNAGVAPEDIVLGVPLYTRGWAGVPNSNNGLFQSASGAASGTWEAGVYDYKDLYNKLQTQPSVYTRYWDDTAQVPFIYSPTDQGGMFSSYEDSQSIGTKTNYIKEKDLGGLFFWELSTDLPSDNPDSLVHNAYNYLTLGRDFIVDPNEINGTSGRDALTGTAKSDRIIGLQGADTLTGGDGKDEFVYTNIRDRGDTITDFEVGKDKIVLTQLLDSLLTGGYKGVNAIADGYVKVVQGNSTSNFSVQIDADGLTGKDIFRHFITVNLVGSGSLNNTANFVF
jgi:chitinase